MEINDKIREVSEAIARQLERDIKLFGSSYLEIGELSIKRIDPTTIQITTPVIIMEIQKRKKELIKEICWYLRRRLAKWRIKEIEQQLEFEISLK